MVTSAFILIGAINEVLVRMMIGKPIKYYGVGNKYKIKIGFNPITKDFTKTTLALPPL